MTQLNSRAACQPHTQLLRLDATQAAPPSGIKSGTTLHSNALKEKQFRRLCSQVSVVSPCLCSYQALCSAWWVWRLHTANERISAGSQPRVGVFSGQ